jgi:hypothetical protein
MLPTCRRCVCVRDVCDARACVCAQNIVFDAHSFTQRGPWTHVIVVHARDRLTLYIDGRVVQRCVRASSSSRLTLRERSVASLVYPRNVTKDRALRLAVGQRLAAAADSSACWWCTR